MRDLARKGGDLGGDLRVRAALLSDVAKAQSAGRSGGEDQQNGRVRVVREVHLLGRGEKRFSVDLNNQ